MHTATAARGMRRCAPVGHERDLRPNSVVGVFGVLVHHELFLARCGGRTHKHAALTRVRMHFVCIQQREAVDNSRVWARRTNERVPVCETGRSRHGGGELSQLPPAPPPPLPPLALTETRSYDGPRFRPKHTVASTPLKPHTWSQM